MAGDGIVKLRHFIWNDEGVYVSAEITIVAIL